MDWLLDMRCSDIYRTWTGTARLPSGAGTWRPGRSAVTHLINVCGAGVIAHSTSDAMDDRAIVVLSQHGGGGSIGGL